MELSTEEKAQYSRHLLLDEIGINGQLKLKKAKVLVIGAGGLGCPILQYLTAAGVGTIGIIDFDSVATSNLQRQILFTHKDIGKNKAKVAAKRLKKLNPYIKFKVYNERLSTINALNYFKKYDIIVDGSDNFATRYLTNDAAIITNKPLVYGGIFKFSGQVSVFNYKNGPTYRCLFAQAPKPEDSPNCSDIGVLGVLPGIIGALQANEVIKIICELKTVLSGKLLCFDALSLQQQLISFTKNTTIDITTLEADYDAFCGIEHKTKEISLSELKNNKENYNLLDVRTLNEREEYNIGGQHIPLDELEKDYTTINTNKNLVVYCASGIRSKKAITILFSLDIKCNLYNLKNGIS